MQWEPWRLVLEEVGNKNMSGFGKLLKLFYCRSLALSIDPFLNAF